MINTTSKKNNKDRKGKMRRFLIPLFINVVMIVLLVGSFVWLYQLSVKNAHLKDISALVKGVNSYKHISETSDDKVYQGIDVVKIQKIGLISKKVNIRMVGHKYAELYTMKDSYKIIVFNEDKNNCKFIGEKGIDNIQKIVSQKTGEVYSANNLPAYNTLHKKEWNSFCSSADRGNIAYVFN